MHSAHKHFQKLCRKNVAVLIHREPIRNLLFRHFTFVVNDFSVVNSLAKNLIQEIRSLFFRQNSNPCIINSNFGIHYFFFLSGSEEYKYMCGFCVLNKIHAYLFYQFRNFLSSFRPTHSQYASQSQP